jgi:hypothetical protein
MNKKHNTNANFKLFENGKLNTNFPRNYNVFLGRVEYSPTNKIPSVNPDYSIIN